MVVQELPKWPLAYWNIADVVNRVVKKTTAKLDPTKCKECAETLTWRDLRYATDHRCRGCQRRADRDKLRGEYVKVSTGPNRATRRRLMKAGV